MQKENKDIKTEGTQTDSIKAVNVQTEGVQTESVQMELKDPNVLATEPYQDENEISASDYAENAPFLTNITLKTSPLVVTTAKFSSL